MGTAGPPGKSGATDKSDPPGKSDEVAEERTGGHDGRTSGSYTSLKGDVGRGKGEAGSYSTQGLEDTGFASLSWGNAVAHGFLTRAGAWHEGQAVRSSEKLNPHCWHITMRPFRNSWSGVNLVNHTSSANHQEPPPPPPTPPPKPPPPKPDPPEPPTVAACAFTALENEVPTLPIEWTIELQAG